MKYLRSFFGFFGFFSLIGTLFVEAIRYVAPALELMLIPPIGQDDHSIAYRASNQVGQNWRNALIADPGRA